jgi:hypothetical protein
VFLVSPGPVVSAAGVTFRLLHPALDQNNEYQVCLTLKGDCEGLYVSGETPQGFEVRELQGGSGSLSFNYRIVAKRKDVVTPRLEKMSKDNVKPLKLSSVPPPEPPDPNAKPRLNDPDR